MPVTYEWRGSVAGAEVEALHAHGFGHEPAGEPRWEMQLSDHSLGSVVARDGARLVGFVNVAWDGSSHAFILDTVVATSHISGGIDTELIAVAVSEAREAGCEWLHVDFEPHLERFYRRCGFATTEAGLLRLNAE